MTRSRPRGHADFRFRTPATADAIQAPSSQFGFVCLVYALVTGATQIELKFDAPFSTPPDLADVGGIGVTQPTTIAQDWGNIGDNAARPVSVVVLTADTIQLNFNAGDLLGGEITENTMFVLLESDGGLPSFPGRLAFLGQVSVGGDGYMTQLQSP